jgi:hypothetical protein
VDVIVTQMPDNSWGLTDLLGRDMGRVTEISAGAFMIQPAGNAIETLAAITAPTYASLDDALAAIEEHTRGVCRRAPPRNI